MAQEIFFTTTPALKARVKQRYSDFIVEEVTPDGEVCKIQKYNKTFEQRKIDGYEELKVPPNPEAYDHLVLEMEKVNVDTITALKVISRGLSVSQKRFGYAGLKDKRGITCQRISAYQPVPAKVERFGVKGIAIRNPKWAKDRIELGDLRGNNFTITLRDISESAERTKEVLEEFAGLVNKGLPNFFGNQRFGGKRMITHRVGKLLLQKNFEDAVMLYLTDTYEEEKEDIKQARINLAKTRDFSAALKEFPMDARTEKAMLNHLVQHPADYAGAFGVLPKKIRYLFIHAYQSHLFNEMLAERIRLLGEKALQEQEGDELINGTPAGLLAGYESAFASEGGIDGKIERKVLANEGITFSDFKVSGMSELSSQGSRKEILVKAENFKVLAVGEDEFNPGKRCAIVSFFLSKGNYATTILRELIKEEVF